MTKQTVIDKAMVFNFQKVSIFESMSEPNIRIKVHCKKGQKWQKRKVEKFNKWITKSKPVAMGFILEKGKSQ